MLMNLLEAHAATAKSGQKQSGAIAKRGQQPSLILEYLSQGAIMKRFIEGGGTCKSTGTFSNGLLPTTHQLLRKYSRQLVLIDRRNCITSKGIIAYRLKAEGLCKWTPLKMELCRLVPIGCLH
ncbi:hypothetical protein [Pseudomonas sp. PAB10]|uniref:hypothetical protein n=1 Tax=Pseudomonas sp. PAB10 TaxID=3233047 RepID=UPI003F9CD3DE